MRDANPLRQDPPNNTAQLREFLSQTKGRRPEEVLGVVAKSSLLQGIIVSCFGCAALLALFTVLPYYLWGPPDAQASSTAAEKVAAPANPNKTKSGAEETVVPESDPTSDPKTADDAPSAERAAEAMGIGEAKMADPDKNPLESRLDQLLDGVE